MDKKALGIELDNKWNSREDRKRVEGVTLKISQVITQLLHRIKAKGTTLYEWAYQYGGLRGLAGQSDTEIKRAYFQFRKELDGFLKGLPTTDVNQFYQQYGQNPTDWSFIKMSSNKRASNLFQKRADALEGVKDGNEVVELADLRDHFETTLTKDKRESEVDHENDPSTENYPEKQTTRVEERDQAPEFHESEKSGPCKSSSSLTDQQKMCKSAALTPADADGTCWACGEPTPEQGALYCPECKEILSEDLGEEGPDERSSYGEDEAGQQPYDMEHPGHEASMEVTADDEGDISGEIISNPSMDYLIDTFGQDDAVLEKAIMDHFSPLYPGTDLGPIVKNIIQSLNSNPEVVNDPQETNEIHSEAPTQG